MKTFVFCIIYLCCVLHSNGTDIHDTFYVASLSHDQIVKNQQGKPSFHLRPPHNWINDPNGPVYYKGFYHLFYQYNPKGAVFKKPIVWGHSVSRDLTNWIHLNNALVPTDPFDINSCYSGSTTILPGNKPVVLYTGLDANNQQVQNLAKPKNLSDPFLKEWIKYSGNPLMTPPKGVTPDNFRDPTTAWKGKDGNWRVAVGGLRGNLGVAILYRSKDFVHWILHDDPLYFGMNTGIWECPDFYPVSVNSRHGLDNSVNGKNIKYVLKASFQSHDYYAIGSYDSNKDKFVPESKGLTGSTSDWRYDYGKFYASKTFYDSVKKRRILWGWINESDSSSDDIKKGWAGIQSIPRQVYLSDAGRQLVQWPIEETEKLREKHVTYSNKKLKGKSLFEVTGITASQVDIQLSFNLPKIEEAEVFDPKWDDPQTLCSTKTASASGRAGPFGLLVMASQDLTEQTAVFFRVFKDNHKFIVLMCSDQSRSSLREGIDKTTYGAFIHMDHEDDMISLRSLVDHSVVESFGADGRACITARVYPHFHVKKEAHLYVFNNGSNDVVIKTLDAWNMKKTKGN
ncbi:putative glycosidase [Helianthus annuus]|uniref:Glycosidase n=1 Tax=Helianthus annuus TaxID=4232 RepID=A0A251UEC5_HELAN|nr:beta-fructofuranosidase, insoluble isoenzyme CWINV3 [Helianthus annuus]KAF5797856.1 putative glycosidase [Helianthus annuus]KAJ0555952.1 putative glycosidase [Helianthus annuus]KAJ0730653.1 putative glycosidase [Helianthus annuus]KAJ0903995.1 putative glycosidase [Helianthus annuus]KAJ0907219.1 putative glycosidase [Helianthus annuus]